MSEKVRYTDDAPKRDAREKKDSVKIDMNPMVDLAFLLLTFFMLTTTFTLPQTMELVMPAKPKESDLEKEQPVKESKTLSIVLSDEDRIFWFRGITDPDIQETDYSHSGLRKLLLEKSKSIPGLIVLIKPDEKSNYRNLVDVLDEMSITNMQRYAIVDITDDDKQLVSSYLDSNE